MNEFFWLGFLDFELRDQNRFLGILNDEVFCVIFGREENHTHRLMHEEDFLHIDVLTVDFSEEIHDLPVFEVNGMYNIIDGRFVVEDAIALDRREEELVREFWIIDNPLRSTAECGRNVEFEEFFLLFT
jgi:hypothetical protein